MCNGMNELHYAFPVTSKDYLLWKKFHLAVIVKQSVESSKQPIIFPLTPLHKADMVAYAWL